MQYFTPHLTHPILDLTDYVQGTIEFNDNPLNVATVNQHLVTDTNRALHNDIVLISSRAPPQANTSVIASTKPDYQVLQIIKRKNTRFVGILRISGTKIIGISKSKTPIYECTPIDWHFPTFHVASNIKKTIEKATAGAMGVRNQIIMFEFKEWLTTQRAPQGTLIRVFGDVGNINAELEALYCHRISQPTKPITDKSLSSIPDPATANPTLKHFKENVITIDPIGSRDFDDAISITSDYLSVHIADPAYYLDHPDVIIDHDYHASKRHTTVYMMHRNYDMLSPKLANDLCSLIQGKPRKTMTVMFKLPLKSKLPECNQIIQSLTTVTHNITYNDANSMFVVQPRGRSVQKLITNFLHQLQKHLDMKDINDSHKLVERVMIMTNHAVGKFLVKHNLPLLRTQADSTNPVNIDKLPYKVKEHVIHRKCNAAIYQYLPNVDQSSYQHAGLELDCYTHFTSPIRRYFDIVVHRLVKHIIGSKSSASNIPTPERLKSICNITNFHNKLLRKLYRDHDILKLYFVINKQNDGQVVTDGYPIDYDAKTTTLSVYLPMYDIEYKYRTFSHKVQHLVSQSRNKETIVLKYEDQTYEIKLSQKYHVRLTTDTTTPFLNRKVKMRLLQLV